jgi:hypothetical protein
MKNHFENFTNSLSGKNALDILSESDKQHLPTNDKGIRPTLAIFNKTRPEIVIKKKKDGKVVVFTKEEILSMQISKNFKVGMFNVSKEEKKAEQKIEKKVKNIAKIIKGAKLKSEKVKGKRLSRRTEKKVLLAGGLITQKINRNRKLSERAKRKLKKMSAKLKVLSPKTKAITKKIVKVIKK